MQESIIIKSSDGDFRTGRSFDNIPLVTIGVLSYNYSQYIETALDSLLTQSYPFIELIIIDDYSEDISTPEKISQWIVVNNVHCTFIQKKKNLGITKVSNILVERAKGKYISLFATDDIMLPEKIERQIKILEEAGEEYGMCYANVETMDEDGKMLGLFAKNEIYYENNALEPYAFNKMSFATPSALIRKDIYKKTGMYDERVLIEDYNFWIRVFACYKVRFCDYPCIIYRIKKRSMIWDKWNENNKELYYHDRILSNFQALKFIKNKRVTHHLKKKISQYLKALAVNRSKYLLKLMYYLLKHGYLRIPYKIVLSTFLRYKLAQLRYGRKATSYNN